MSRPLAVAILLLAVSALPLVSAGAADKKKKPAPAPSASPRVYTNDDLEAARKSGAPVQDLKAVGGELDYPSSDPSSRTAVESSEGLESPPPPDATEERIRTLEQQAKDLDDQAKQLLWAYLQSTDTNEILQLKAQQQEVINQLEATKAEIARLRGDPNAPPAPPPPTPPPG